MEVCLEPASKGQPIVVDCPASRSEAVGTQPGLVECNGTNFMRLGIQIPPAVCKDRTAPCAAVPALPSSCKAVTVLPGDLPITDFEARGAR